MAKPASKPSWTVGNPSFGTVTVEPSSGKKLNGWTASERIPFQFLNWLFFNINEWITYLEEQVDLVASSKSNYDAIVGTGGTHSDLASLMADVNIAAKKNIMVVSPQTITAPVVINQDDMKFDFKPQAFIAKGPGANIGVQITGKRVKFSNCRFLNFNTAGDKAMQLSAAAQWCMVWGCYFLNCDTSIEDLGPSNVLTMNIEEV